MTDGEEMMGNFSIKNKRRYYCEKPFTTRHIAHFCRDCRNVHRACFDVSPLVDAGWEYEQETNKDRGTWGHPNERYRYGTWQALKRQAEKEK